MARNRRQIRVKGLGNLEARQTDPVNEADFTKLGFLGGTGFTDAFEMEEVPDEQGNLIDVKERGQRVMIESSLLQTDFEQIDYMANTKGKLHNVRYLGQDGPDSFKYFCLEQARIVPGVTLPFKAGLRPLPFVAKSLSQEEAGYSIPLYHLIQTGGPMFLDKMKLWVSPRGGKNYLLDRFIDASGFARHGQITSDYATIWQAGTPTYFGRFDGVNDSVDFGDILDDDGTADMYFEIWARVQAADGTAQEIMGKKTLSAGTTAGWSIYRNASNQIVFTIGSGSASANVVSAATLLQNVWKKIGVAIDRNGNGQVYVNGVASGAAVAVSAIGTGANALSLFMARDGTNFGQVDLGDARVMIYGAGGLPASIATIDAAHYAAEKTLYGL